MTHSNRKKPAKQKKIHKCQVCNKEFTGPAKLERHEKVHGDYHDCGDCGRRFKHIDNFHKHACLTKKIAGIKKLFWVNFGQSQAWAGLGKPGQAWARLLVTGVNDDLPINIAFVYSHNKDTVKR